MTLYVETWNGLEVVSRLFTTPEEAHKYGVHRLSPKYPEVPLTGDTEVDLTRLMVAWAGDPDESFMWYTTENIVLFASAEDAIGEEE
jgi:hypothetical protein